MEKTGIQQAVEAKGGQTALAEALGVAKQAVQGWVDKGFAPVGRARQISHASGVDPRLLVDPVIRDLFEVETRALANGYRAPQAPYPPQHPDGDEGL